MTHARSANETPDQGPEVGTYSTGPVLGADAEQPTLLDEVTRFAADNPALAVAGGVAIGAIVAMALMPRRAAPISSLERLKRDIADQTHDLSRKIEHEVRRSGLDARVSAIGNGLSNFDWSPYLKPVVDQAVSIVEDARQRLASAAK